MSADLPTHVVLNKRTGDVIAHSNGGHAMFASEARDFADTMNARNCVPIFLVCKLVPEYAHERPVT